MKKNFDIRLAALREYLKSLSADETTFVVEGGGEYHTKEDPFNYLMQHGAFTHDGKCIVLYPAAAFAGSCRPFYMVPERRQRAG